MKKVLLLIVGIILPLLVNAQYLLNKLAYPDARPGESAFDYGYRKGKEAQEKARLELQKEYLKVREKATLAKDGPIIIVNGSTTPQNSTIRFYLEQDSKIFKDNGAVVAEPGEGEEGLLLKLYYGDPSEIIFIGKDGTQLRRWLLGLLETGSEASKYLLIDDNDLPTGLSYLFVDKAKENIVTVTVNDSKAHFDTRSVYDRTKERAQGSVNTTTGVPINNGSMFDNTGNSSGSVNNTCRSCGGSGVCRSCGGTRYYVIETGSYTGYDTKAVRDCPSCHGSGRCSTCYGSGRIR